MYVLPVYVLPIILIILRMIIFQDDLDRFLAVAQKLKLEGLGGEDQGEEKPYNDDSNYSVKEEVNYESYITTTESEKKATYKPRRTVKKVEGTISLNSNGGEATDLDEKLLEHISKLPDRTLQCKICGNTAKQMSDIKNHIETHMEGLSVPCPICGKIFRSRNSMRTHKSQYHK